MLALLQSLAKAAGSSQLTPAWWLSSVRFGSVRSGQDEGQPGSEAESCLFLVLA